MMRRFKTAALLAGAALALLPSGAHACAVCMGADEHMGQALNGAIFLMLGCIGSMLSLITAVGVVMVRRAHHPLPPHSEFLEPESDPDSDKK